MSLAQWKRKDVTEDALRDSIYEYLLKRGAYVVRDKQTKNRPRVLFSESVGVSDIWGVWRDGRFIGVEVKKPTGTVSLPQIRFLEEIKKRGGIAIIATSVEDVQKGLP